MDPRLLQVLCDVDLGRVRLGGDNNDAIIPNGMFIDPAQKSEYDRAVRWAMDAGLVMEIRPGGRHTGLLRLTTPGELDLIRHGGRVAV